MKQLILVLALIFISGFSFADDIDDSFSDFLLQQKVLFDQDHTDSTYVTADDLLKIKNFYLPEYDGEVYFQFSMKGNFLYMDELQSGDVVYSQNYSHLMCGDPTNFTAALHYNSSIKCFNFPEDDPYHPHFVYIKAGLNAVSGRPYLNLLLGPSVGYRPNWVAQQDLQK